MDNIEGSSLRRRPSRATAVGHFFGVLAAILLLTWLLHFRGGLDLDSDNKDKVFNVHPFLMYAGFVFLAGEAIMAYKTFPMEKKVRKFIHMLLHLVAIVLGIVGINAAFKFHNEVGIPNMFSLHSWLGMGTFCLFCLQWLYSFVTFFFPGAEVSTRGRMLPWHKVGGRTLLYMAVCTAESGLMEKATVMNLRHGTESRLMNFTGLAILFFGIAVDFTISVRVSTI
ncbi:PREDICTED: probable transmembrane ascorbate ferrireductase 3 [Nelumbo nucifera]|uniref:Cytochrome b561 domain-containing protein n=2 Tax=Nelumbo nucifera TaxID=4432 RepID=A0A822YN28_NELNU|nr:PREDICTED: probable transmembrane ascorbate ferrireductase 3 [Nelumbo nucifera]DAD32306.1 TPA_asm: hypothetical protein HUJ06_011157 [Nelumbo nucifera]